MIIRINKLIRDNVPSIMAKRGKHIAFHEANSDEEYWMKLKERFQNEMKDIDQIPEGDNVALTRKMAEVLEIIDAIIVLKRIDLKEVDAVRENMTIDLGKYEKRYIAEESDEELDRAQEEYKEGMEESRTNPSTEPEVKPWDH